MLLLKDLHVLGGTLVVNPIQYLPYLVSSRFCYPSNNNNTCKTPSSSIIPSPSVRRTTSFAGTTSKSCYTSSTTRVSNRRMEAMKCSKVLLLGLLTIRSPDRSKRSLVGKGTQERTTLSSQNDYRFFWPAAIGGTYTTHHSRPRHGRTYSSSRASLTGGH